MNWHDVQTTLHDNNSLSLIVNNQSFISIDSEVVQLLAGKRYLTVNVLLAE